MHKWHPKLSNSEIHYNYNKVNNNNHVNNRRISIICALMCTRDARTG